MVDDHFSLPVLLDEIILAQQLKLVGYAGLFPVQSFADFRDAHRVLN